MMAGFSDYRIINYSPSSSTSTHCVNICQTRNSTLDPLSSNPHILLTPKKPHFIVLEPNQPHPTKQDEEIRNRTEQNRTQLASLSRLTTLLTTAILHYNVTIGKHQIQIKTNHSTKTTELSIHRSRIALGFDIAVPGRHVMLRSGLVNGARQVHEVGEAAIM